MDKLILNADKNADKMDFAKTIVKELEKKKQSVIK